MQLGLFLQFYIKSIIQYNFIFIAECTKYLWRDLYPRNACRAYEFAKLFEEPVLLDKSMQMIRNQSKEILVESTFEDVEHSTLCIVLG